MDTDTIIVKGGLKIWAHIDRRALDYCGWHSIRRRIKVHVQGSSSIEASSWRKFGRCFHTKKSSSNMSPNRGKEKPQFYRRRCSNATVEDFLGPMALTEENHPHNQA